MKKFCFLLAAMMSFVIAAAQNIPNKSLNDSVFKEGDIIRFPAVLYDLSRATLRPESGDSLDHVVRFMQKYPKLVLEMQNHCDTRVNPNRSVRLTQVRAQSCVDYLITRGIASTRLIAKGYHCHKPIVTDAEIAKLTGKNAIEEAHQKNRRTVLKVLRTDHYVKVYKTLNDSVFNPGNIIPLNILYDLAKPTFRPECKPTLDSAIAFLKENEHLIVELGVHTDTRDIDSHNLDLSQMRARSCYEYMTFNGIERSQLTYKGYGENEPLIPESVLNRISIQEEKDILHQKNRRTELKIIVKDRGKTWKELLMSDEPPNIYVTIPVEYDLKKNAAVKPEYYDSLDVLVEFMNKYKNAVIEIGAHTDSINPAASWMPTETMARNCAEYLFSKGISKERVVPKGYGATRVLILRSEIDKLQTWEAKAAAHKKNRRTEIRVLRSDYIETDRPSR